MYTIRRRVVYYVSFFALLVALFFLGGLSAFGQTFSTGFANYTNDTLYLNGWDFNTVNYNIFNDGAGNLVIRSADLTGSQEIRYINSGYFYVETPGSLTLSFQTRSTFQNNNTRPEFIVEIFNVNDNPIQNLGWTLVANNNNFQNHSFNITNITAQGWYYFRLGARRSGTNSVGTTIIRFDNFGGTLPTNTFWPELSPNVTVTDLFSVSDAEIEVDEQTVLDFTFEYNEVIPSSSQRAVRGMEYQIDLHAGLEYISHTITGTSAGSGASYDPNTGIFTIEAIQKTVPLVLSITVEGTANCPNCEVEITELNANVLQPMAGFGQEIQILSVLPVELIYFRAEPKKEQAKVELSWATASEKDNDYFTIERSKDGLRFHEIARIEGAGTHVGTLTYTHIDFTPLNGVAYYRLKQTDFDGKFSYSDLVRVNLPSSMRSINIATTPLASGEKPMIWLQGDWDTSEQLNFLIIDTKGAQVWQSTAKAKGRELQLDSDFPNLSAGVYMVSVFSNSYRMIKKILVGN